MEETPEQYLKICSKLTIKTQGRRHLYRSGFFVVKACVRYFLSNLYFFHQMIACQKL